jgi:hypothetical protein
VEVSFAFGYPVSDSAGTINVELRDSAAAGEPSIVPWLRAFPRRLVLQPGQRQVLRVLVQPPADLAEGEYWGRVLVRARGGQPPIEQTNGDVRVQLNVETVIATALMFRKGAVETGITVSDARAEATPEGVQLTVDVARQGTAAYLGRRAPPRVHRPLHLRHRAARPPLVRSRARRPRGRRRGRPLGPRMRLPRSLALLAAALGLAGPAAAQAVKPQASGGLIVSATILEAPIVGTGVNPLTFGSIAPGTTSVTVLPRTAAGGEWRLSGVRNRRSVAITFTLPASLTGPGGATIPLSFNGNYAGLCEIDNNGLCVVASYVTIGGRALPAVGQRAGRYTGTIGVTLVVN